MRTVKNLHRRMITSQASNIALSSKAGVSVGVVEKARKGLPVRDYLADSIEQALEQHKFFYLPFGPKPKK